MSTDGERDMFWDLPWDEEAEIDKCRQLYDVSPDPYFPAIEFGGWDALRGASNVVFSSGSLDPWSGMSMTDSQLAPSTIIVLVIHDAAHHLDLFWSHESDSWHLRLARILEKEAIKRWLSESPPTPS
jgi:lysosomal Pro-X carboxypeptidase